MKLRPSDSSDIDHIMSIIHDAQVLLASLNIDQWQDGYPTVEQIKADIEKSDSYVVENNDGDVIATTVLCATGESTYNQIEGEWLTPQNTPYGVIHRLAVKAEYRQGGIAHFIFDTCEANLLNKGITTMRIDTHEDNKGMQRLIEKRDYIYCGVIYLDSGAKRLAYEKILKA